MKRKVITLFIILICFLLESTVFYKLKKHLDMIVANNLKEKGAARKAV